MKPRRRPRRTLFTKWSTGTIASGTPELELSPRSAERRKLRLPFSHGEKSLPSGLTRGWRGAPDEGTALNDLA